jgi:two-component system sensor histidine kinase UhpB
LAVDALKQAEDRLVIDTIPAMVWGMGPDGVMDFINQRWLSYTGLSREEALEDSMQAVHPEDQARVMERWLIDKAAGLTSEDELRLRRADGEYRWFLIRTVPVRDEQGNIVKWFGTSTDIDGRKQAEEKLRGTSEQLRTLSARLQSAREEEGIRIAREIHDELGNTLTSLRWELEGVQKANPDLKEKLEAMVGLTDTMITVVRRIASDLRPVVLDVLGLEEAIEWQMRHFQDRTGIAVNYESSGAGNGLSPAQSIAVFRILQEALTNVMRHARATRLDVTVAENIGAFVLMIRDNGRGITESERTGTLSIGLLGMHERALLIGGDLDVNGIEGEGTTVTLRVPIQAV